MNKMIQLIPLSPKLKIMLAKLGWWFKGNLTNCILTEYREGYGWSWQTCDTIQGYYDTEKEARQMAKRWMMNYGWSQTPVENPNGDHWSDGDAALETDEDWEVTL